MKTIAAPLSLTFLASIPLLTSCVPVNALVNVKQDREIDYLRGRLHIIECRHLATTERGRVLLAYTGEGLALDLETLDYPQNTRPNDEELFWLIPAEPEWATFRELAQNRRSSEKLGWSCSARLCRQGVVDPGAAKLIFSSVPAGTYDLFAHWTRPAAIAGGMEARRFRHAFVDVHADSSPTFTPLRKVSDDRKGSIESSSDVRE